MNRVSSTLCRCLVILLCLLASPSWAKDTVVIGSKTFPESRILAEMMAQVLENSTDLIVTRRLGLGGTMVCFDALNSGQLDIYPEYTGTGVLTILKRSETYRDPLRTYLDVRRGFQEEFELEWLRPFGFNNTYVLAVPKKVAQKYDLETISDLKPVEDKIRAGVNHEFLSRPDGFPGLRKAYGLKFANATGMEHGLAYQAIASGKIDLIDAYSTDGELLRYGLVALKDDKNFFPPYQAAPVVRQDLLRRHPEVRTALEKLSFQLTEKQMQTLNFEVQDKQRPIPEVVTEFLQGIDLGVPGAKKVQVFDQGGRRGGFLAFMNTRKMRTFELIRRHLYLSGISLLLAILIGVPTGIFISRYPKMAQPVLGAAGVIQTIPSIALLAFLIPVPGLGLGTRSAIVALFLYALLPIIRNTYTGLQEVDSGLLEAAEGMGLTRRQRLTLVELPLATRTIMAGIRTSAVINVGVATLAAFIGAGGLGDPIVAGLQLNDTDLILAGALPAAALAIVVDQSLGVLERFLSPKGLSA